MSSLEDCPAKKMPFFLPIEADEEEEVMEEIDYFPESAIKQEAFKRFCKGNELYSAERKNNVYEILRDKKYVTTLKDMLHQEFDVEVKNLIALVKKGELDLEGSKEFSEYDYKIEGMDEIPVNMVRKEEEEENSAFDLKVLSPVEILNNKLKK